MEEALGRFQRCVVRSLSASREARAGHGGGGDDTAAGMESVPSEGTDTAGAHLTMQEGDENGGARYQPPPFTWTSTTAPSPPSPPAASASTGAAQQKAE